MVVTKQQGIGKMQPSGMYNEYSAPQGAQTGGLIKGPDGNMWFTEPIVNRIGMITMSGQAKDYPIPGTGKDPGDITVGADGIGSVTGVNGDDLATKVAEDQDAYHPGQPRRKPRRKHRGHCHPPK